MPDAAEITAGPVAPRRARWGVIGAVAAVPFLLMAVAFVVGYRRSAAVLQAEIERLRDRGEPVWFADLAPARGDPSIAAGEKLAAALKRPPHLSEALRQFVNTEPHPPLGEFPELMVEVDSQRAALDSILALVRRADCRFSFDFSTRSPSHTLLANTQYLTQAGNVLSADGWLALGRGDGERAVEVVGELLDLGEPLHHDPFFVSQMNRSGIEERAVDLLQGVLEQGRPAVPTAFESRLERAERRFRVAPAVRGERAGLLTTIENLGSRELELDDVDAKEGGITHPRLQNIWWGSPAAHQPMALGECTSRFRSCARCPRLPS